MLSSEGKEITLYRLGPQEVCILSASCILQNITFDVCVEAESDTEALLIPSAQYQKLIKQNIYAENFTYSLVVDRFSNVMWAKMCIRDRAGAAGSRASRTGPRAQQSPAGPASPGSPGFHRHRPPKS